MSAPADGRGGPAVDALVAAGMRFGSLLHVAHPSLVARYRRAMVSMGLPPTTLEDFYIDACGFSPEVAHDIGDDDYLDPYGVNRRLIILTPEQRKLPFLNSVLSADIELIRQFYAANERAIRVLTLKDAVYGEVEDLIFRAASLSDLMGVRTVRFILHTTAGVLEAATEAKGLAERFLAEPDAWKDDTLQDAIIEAAKQCGDVRTNGIIPANLSFPWPSVFRTSLFGGVYLFRNQASSLVVGPEASRAHIDGTGASFIPFEDVGAIFEELRAEGYVEPFNETWLRTSGVIAQRQHLLAVMLMTEIDANFDPCSAIDPADLNRFALPRIEVLLTDERFRAISDLRQALAQEGAAALYEQRLAPHLRLLFRRAIPDHPGVWDINRLLLRFVRFDFLSVYALDKPGFYEAYKAMDSRLKVFAVHYVLRHYHSQPPDLPRKKAEFRERIFGILPI